MNRKRIFYIILIGIVTIVFSAPASWAGSPAQHRLEGVAIGIGALILTKAIIDHHRHDMASVTPAGYYRKPHRPRHRPAGYWDIEKAWVPPKYDKVWNPGHYNRRGRWIPGHWMEIEVEPGHWSERKVWVPYQ